MRNKPKVISLKTPSFEGLVVDPMKAILGQNNNTKAPSPSSGGGRGRGGDKEKLAEEGRGGADVEDDEGDHGFALQNNELHPIMGSTRTGQGSLVVGRPLEVRFNSITFSTFVALCQTRVSE